MTKNELNRSEKQEFGRKALAWLILSVATGLLIFGIKSYVETVRQTVAEERTLGVMQKLCELKQVDYLLRRLGEGESHEVKQVLALQLSSGLRDARESLAVLDPVTREFADGICDRVARAQRRHPEYYLVASKSTSSVDSGAPKSGALSGREK